MKLCDKCGGDMPYPMAAMKFPSFRIAKNPGIGMPFQDIDLCPECSKRLDACLKARPDADAEPVRYGRWSVIGGKIRRDIDRRIVKCTLCNNNLSMEGVNCGRGDANYCPNCGAKMYKEADDV